VPTLPSSRKVLTLLAAVATAGLAAACGASTPSAGPATGGSASSKTADMVAFAECMRSHAVPDFPDIGPGSHGGMRIQNDNGVISVNGVRLDGPAFQSAMQTCHSKLPGGGQPQPLSQSGRRAILKWAQCMRGHGVPNFPDPTIIGGAVRIQLGATGLNPQSPAFKSAQQACGSVIQKLSRGRGPEAEARMRRARQPSAARGATTAGGCYPATASQRS
jgi:hypothetical protein